VSNPLKSIRNENTQGEKKEKNATQFSEADDLGENKVKEEH